MGSGRGINTPMTPTMQRRLVEHATTVRAIYWNSLSRTFRQHRTGNNGALLYYLAQCCTYRNVQAPPKPANAMRAWIQAEKYYDTLTGL